MSVFPDLLCTASSSEAPSPPLLDATATVAPAANAGACPQGDAAAWRGAASLALSGCHSHGTSEPLAKLVHRTDWVNGRDTSARQPPAVVSG